MTHHIYHAPEPGSTRTRLAMLLLLVLLAFLLTACGSTALLPATDDTEEPTTEEPAAMLPTAEPTVALPTAEPTTVLPTVAEPTVEEPTSAPPTVEEPSPVPPTAESTTAPTTAPTASEDATPDDNLAAFGDEILFLRNGVLIAYNPDTDQERQIADSVVEFAATEDGRTLALIRRNEGLPQDIWLFARDGSNTRQVTNDTRRESSLSWAPDGQTLAYASATTARPALPEWVGWSEWCASSEVHLLDVASTTSTPLEAGCDPAFSSDGLRLAFATPPQTVTSGVPQTPTDTNTIRLVNRQGENGWSFASAGLNTDAEGHLVYAPAWSPDNEQVAYQRFMGYQALVDINYTEMGGSFQGNGDLLTTGAGWLLPPDFAPDGTRMVVVAHNYSSAAGYTGYMTWSVQVLEPGKSGEVILPTGTRPTSARLHDQLTRATAAAWAPDSSALVVALPPDWTATAPTSQPPQPDSASNTQQPGDLWLWEPANTPGENVNVPGNAPGTLLVQDVDFASPLLWLPALS